MEYSSFRAPCLNTAGNPEVVLLECVMKTGIPEFQVAGLAPSRAREAMERLSCGLQMHGLRFGHKRITVNVEGRPDPDLVELLDLPILVTILLAQKNRLPGLMGKATCLGKLSLSGAIRPLNQPARLLAVAGHLGFQRMLSHISYPLKLCDGSATPERIETIQDLLRGNEKPVNCSPIIEREQIGPVSQAGSITYGRKVMRAAVAAAEARHSLMCLGPPGSGKTTLAGAIYEMLPPADETEAREIFFRNQSEQEPGQRPFRRPHHSSTVVAMIGGGTPIRCGEVTRANHGMLLLDELGEFRREVLQSLREPMDNYFVHISRGNHREALPCHNWWIATANPCKCGMAGSSGVCRCTEASVRQYQTRMLGALEDRIDIQLFVESDGACTGWDEINFWRENLRNAQQKRTRSGGYRFNADIEDLERWCILAGGVYERFHRETEGWSNRKKHRIRRLARSIADMSGAAWIQMEHLLEALRYSYAGMAISQESAKAPSLYG